MPIDWSNNNSARKRLREALVKNDPKARLADTFCEDTGISLARIDFSPPGENIWFSVIDEAKKSGRVPALVALAAERWSTDATLQELAAGVPAPAASPQRPAAPALPLAVGAGVVADALAERALDPLEKMLSDLQIPDAAQWAEDYKARMGRVALVLVNGAASGTGFLIGPDLLLTNWHVVANAAGDKVMVRFDYWRPPGGLADKFFEVSLHSDWLVDRAPWSQADLTADAAALPGIDELDFAVLRLARPVGDELRDGVKRGWITLPAATNVSLGQSVLILQHPNGHPLRLAFDGVLSVNANNTRIRYRTNTLPGSSGSPCFDQNWQLLALHHSGDPRLAPVYNEGIPAAAIRRLIEQRNKVSLPAAT